MIFPVSLAQIILVETLCCTICYCENKVIVFRELGNECGEKEHLTIFIGDVMERNYKT